MKHTVLSIAAMAALSSLTMPAFAETEYAETHLKKLEQQLSALQQEVRSLKGQIKVQHHQKRVPKMKVPVAKNPTAAREVAQERSASALPVPRSSLQANTMLAQRPLVFQEGQDIDVPGQSYVTTGPYIGVPWGYSGGGLIINTPTINEDIALLNIRKNIRQRLRALNRSVVEEHSHLLLSGMIETQATYKDRGTLQNTSDFDLTSANLDGYILGPSSWISGLMALSYDNNRGSDVGTINSNSRPVNSRLFVDRAFVVVGDFEQSPLYSSLGQMYVPFGSYGTNMISSPLTKLLGRTKARALLVGYRQPSENAFYLAGYAFEGDSYATASNRINNGGLNIGYRFNSDNFGGDIGGGVIANIADSQGMQDTGNSPLFGGFGGPTQAGKEQITHEVHAINLRGSFHIGENINLLAEYVGATQDFSRADLTFNNHGARPQALNAEFAYTFKMGEKPGTIAVGYGRSRDTLALGIPAHRFSVACNTSFWRNTLQSIEFRHDSNFARSATSTGSGVAGPSGLGKSDNMVNAQFDLYF